MSSRLMTPRRGATRPRSRGAIVAAALVLCGAVIAVEGSTATFAAERERLDLQALKPAGLVPAIRVKPPKVAPPAPPKPVARPAPPPAPVFAPITSALTEEQRVFELTNAARVAAGHSPLTMNDHLNTAALIHAIDQRNQPCALGFLSHVGTDGSRGVDRIQRTGASISRWGENIACSFRTAEAVTAGWLASSGHRANMMNPRFTHTGVAIGVSDTGQLYWVQIFATLR